MSRGILSFSIFGTHKIEGILSWGILSQVNFSLGDFVMGDFVVDPMPRYLKFSLRMLKILKIFPDHIQKPKSFPNQPISLNYVLFTSTRVE